MKKFKIIIAMLLAVALSALCACGTSGGSSGSNDSSGGGDSPKKTYTFVAPDGAPALSIAKQINDGENFGMNADVNYSVVSASNIGSFMQKGTADFIIMPVNAASKLYKANASDPYKMAAVITHGNLYILSSDGSDSLAALKGKVVGVIGRGLVPDLTFKAILSDNDLLGDVVDGDTAAEGKITLRYFDDASTMLPLLKQGKLSCGLLPEPAATKLVTAVAPEKTWTKIDVQELYDGEKKAYPQAVLMVKSSVYSENKALIDGMASYFSANTDWVKQNTELAVGSISGALAEGVTPSLTAANLTAEVVDNCKIYFEGASAAKQSVLDYIAKIIAINENSAKTPADDFFA